MSEQSRQLSTSHLFAFSADDFSLLHNLASIPSPYPLIVSNDVQTPEHFITYIDTTDYRLRRCGFAAWIEQTDNGLHLSLENLAANLSGKVDKRIYQRMNLTEPIANEKVAMKLKGWPRALRKTVAPALKGRVKFHPLVRLQHTHEAGMLIAPPAADTKQSEASLLLAELSLDRFIAWHSNDLALSPPMFPTDHAVASLGRLSLAFDPNATTEQAQILAWLADQAGLQPTSLPIVDQAVAAGMVGALGETETGVGLQPQMLVVDACRLAWHAQFLALLFVEAGVRYSRSQKYVHEMRVAIRRMRSLAKLYGHFFPRKTLRPYLAALKHTAHLLGSVRNLDVALANARRQRTHSEQSAQAPKKLLKEWRIKRRTALEALIHWLDSNEYGEFLASFQQFCVAEADRDNDCTPNTETMLAPQQLRHVIPTQLLAGYAAVRCYEAIFEMNGAVDINTLHELRLACKALRYNLEFAQPLLGAEIVMVIDRLKALQELLGDLNDTVTARSLIDDADKDEDASDYRQWQAALADDLITRVPAALSGLVDQTSREALGKALACL